MHDPVLLIFHCARVDRGAVVDALQDACTQPIHVIAEDVFGRDFDDAGAAEQVNGALDRMAVELIAPRADTDGLISAVGAARRRMPVRWRLLPVLAQGRIA